ncbi:MAG TPA: NAD(+) synthase [Anaerolineales bacterium]|nr:NAD(+) synthase [Anaerolineales bacterium]
MPTYAIAQINPIIGDFAGNVSLCVQAAQQARAQGADVVLFPEMCITGYPARDLLYDDSFVAASLAAVDDLAKQCAEGVALVVGSVWRAEGAGKPSHPHLHNAALLLQAGEVRCVAQKRLLPTYNVYLEERWFVPGKTSAVFELAGETVGALICEDLWDEGYGESPGMELVKQGATTLLCLSATPFRLGVANERVHHARRLGCRLLYCNSVGSQDELIFDGNSFVMEADGHISCQLPAFAPSVQCALPQPVPTPANEIVQIRQALQYGIADFFAKNQLKHAFLGLSGGIDSAVVAVLAKEALGSANVTALAMPSRYTDPRSTSNALQLAKNLGIACEVVEIDPVQRAMEKLLPDLVTVGTTAENIQARVRMVILMAYVNAQGGVLLNTSNKTELSLGYGTLYGDLAGALSPLGDLTKLQVQALAREINRTDEVIPPFILTRPPSAELRPEQVDPFDYEQVAPYLEDLVQSGKTNAILHQSEHKRKQFGIILRVSRLAFGSGRLLPISKKSA